MTIDEHVMPPAWARFLLPLLLTPANQESVPGDLLEEYRETIRPARGRWGADLWYVRQVAGFLWRVSLPWAVLLSTAHVVRELFDIFAPPATLMGYGPRSAITTWVAVATFLALGFHSAYRSGHAKAGAFVAMASSALAHLSATPVMMALFFGVVQRDPVMLWRFRATGGFGEGLVLVPAAQVVGAVLALCGGVVGRLVTRIGAPRSDRAAML